MGFQRNHLHLCLMILPFLNYGEAGLLSACRSTQDCGVDHSFCHSGICICKPYYAQYKTSACLPARLLDQECIIGEQCALKVALSTCTGGRCRCTDGYIQFRRHTCLQAAKPGDICLSNEHCKLWSRNSHCLFFIPNLIGRCACSGHATLHGSNCLTDEEAIIFENDPPMEAFAENQTLSNPQTNKNISHNESESASQGNEYNLKSQPPPQSDPSISDPFYDQRKHHSEENSLASTPEPDKGETPATNKTAVVKFQSESDVLTQAPMVQNQLHNDHRYGNGIASTTDNVLEGSPSSVKTSNGTDDDLPHINYWKRKGVISLGLPCVSDEQCQGSDPESRCIQNRCDCAVQMNGTEFCGREYTDCPSETFQCHSTGRCISWFFVCDGRRDCSDGSDEDCSGPPCPKHSYQCERSGMCVSRSVICDGIRNCPDGEDEQLCGNGTEQCARRSFRCRNGQCVPEHEFCNAIPFCSDGSDELEEVCGSRFAGGRASQHRNCPFLCGNGRCRSTAIMCTGRDGCGDNSDEDRCTVCRCPRPIRPPNPRND